MRKNSIIFFILMTFCFILIPKNVFAETIYLTQESFDIQSEEPVDGIYFSDAYYLLSNEYVLTENIDVEYQIYVDGEDVSIDFNNYVLYYQSDDVITVQNHGSLHIFGGSLFGLDHALLVNDSSLISENMEIGGLDSQNSNVTLRNCEVGGFITSYHSRYDKSVTIDGGTYSNDIGISIFGSSQVNIYDAKISGFYGLLVDVSFLNNEIAFDNLSSVNIYGGDFSGVVSGLITTSESKVKLHGGNYSQIEDAETFCKIANSFFCHTMFGQENTSGAIHIIQLLDVESSFYDLLAPDYEFFDELQYQDFEFSSGEYTFYGIVASGPLSVRKHYQVIEGENSSYSGKDLIMKVNGEYNLFERLLVDGNEVDSKDFELESGGIVTLKKEYLSTLFSGSHDITFVYTDGVATTKLFVLNNPKTFIISIAMIIELFVIILFPFVIYRKKNIH